MAFAVSVNIIRKIIYLCFLTVNTCLSCFQKGLIVMRLIKITAAVLISIISILSVSSMVLAHGGHHRNRIYKNTNYCIHGNNYIDANNDGICDNCHYLTGARLGYGHHGNWCH